MADVATKLLLPHLCRLLARHDTSVLSDGQLVERFHRHGEEAAFAELVRRHGPMVLGVCRNILHNLHDAEDAFQATFLVLARKAGAIRRQEAVAGWLFRVASHVASQAAARNATRPRCIPELEGIDMTASDPLLDLTVRELRRALYEELERLPEKYRGPLVLCYLQGRTQDEAARELGGSKGALRGQLIRGRALLRTRLIRRGLAPSAGLLTLGLASAAALPPNILGDTVQAGLLFRKGMAAGAVSAKVAALAQSALQTLFLSRLKAGSVCLVLAALLVATGVLAHQGLGQIPVAGKEEPAREVTATEREGDEKARVDAFGDPLPDEAVSRLGTLRFRHGQAVTFVRFTPDGQVLVTQGVDGARTWEVATGKQIHFVPLETTVGAWGSDLSLDGKRLVTASDAGLSLWEVATAKQVRTFGSKCSRACFSPDGKRIVALQRDNADRVECWEASTGQQLWSTSLAKDPQKCLAFSPDGKTVIVAGWGSIQTPPRTDNTLFFLDAATGVEQRRLDLGTDTPYQLAFSPDGARLAVRGLSFREKSGASRIRVWEAASGKELVRLEPPTPEGSGRQKHFSAMSFSPDGKSLLTAGGDDGLLVWDLATGKEQRRLGRGLTNSYALAFSPDAKAVAVGHPGSWIRLIDWATGEDLGASVGNRWGAFYTAFTPDDRTVVTASAGPGFVLWDPATGKERRRFEVNDFPAGYLLAKGGRTAFSTNALEKNICCWDLATGKELSRLSLDFVGGQPHVKAIGPGGKVLAVGAFDSDTVYLIDVTTGKTLQTFKDPGRQVRQADFTADGRTLVTFCEDLTAQVWDVARGEKGPRLGPMGGDGRARGFPVPVGGGGPSYAAALSPDGSWVAYGSQSIYGGQSGELHVIDVATGKTIHRLDNLPSGAGVLSFSPSGRMLAWGGWRDPVLHLLEVASGKERQALIGHRGTIHSLSFSGDGKTLVSGSSDTTGLIWDLTGQRTAAALGGKALARADLDALWAALVSEDAARAFEALRKLAACPAEALPFLEERLRPVRPVDEKRLAGLIADLDSSQFPVRQQAARELEQLGELAVPACRQALAGRPSAEARRRLEEFVEKQAEDRRKPSAEGLRTLRALEVLELIATPDTRRLLLVLAEGVPEARLTREARATLDRITQRGNAAP
jgi:RNA polymerase sigma factor (sigma-70 family)